MWGATPGYIGYLFVGATRLSAFLANVLGSGCAAELRLPICTGYRALEICLLESDTTARGKTRRVPEFLREITGKKQGSAPVLPPFGCLQLRNQWGLLNKVSSLCAGLIRE